MLFLGRIIIWNYVQIIDKTIRDVRISKRPEIWSMTSFTLCTHCMPSAYQYFSESVTSECDQWSNILNFQKCPIWTINCDFKITPTQKPSLDLYGRETVETPLFSGGKGISPRYLQVSFAWILMVFGKVCSNFWWKKNLLISDLMSSKIQLKKN